MRELDFRQEAIHLMTLGRNLHRAHPRRADRRRGADDGCADLVLVLVILVNDIRARGKTRVRPRV